MGKKKAKITVYGAIEGDREELLLKHLIDLYQPRKNGINPTFVHSSGGTSNKILGMALKACDRKRSFAWLDEDFYPTDPLNSDNLEYLADKWGIERNSNSFNEFVKCPLKDLQSNFNPKKRNPILIVSQPVSVESLILRTLGIAPCHAEMSSKILEKQKRELKSSLNGVLGQISEADYYKQNLTKDVLEKRRKEVPELDLLISMITK